jgi:endonuclease-3
MTKNLKKRAAWIFKNLQKTYPDAHCELTHRSPLELLVATILSAQCTDKRVNLVTKDLFKKYRSSKDYANAPLRELEQRIRSTGFYRNKALNIQRACRDITEKYKGKVPDTMEELTRLAGIGRKTANVILGTAFGRTEGIVVDTHVIRISRLLGLTKEKDAVKIEQDLIKLFPKKNWNLLSHLITWHGRRCCVARRPDCLHCVLRIQCPYGVQYKK